jgi:cobalt-zinc-cadmium efflux system membrane fusion protein
VEALAVPAKSIVRESDGTMTAWVTADNRHFTRKTVLPGQRKDDHVQIVAGLTAGEKVVSEGGVFLSNLLDAPPTD